MWTDKRVDVLRTDWAQGATARQIAEKLGGFEHLADRGRNAVIGKLHRLGLARSAETNAQRLGRINKRRRAYRAALSATRAKPIAKPVVGTVRVGVEQDELQEGVDYEVDVTTRQPLPRRAR